MLDTLLDTLIIENFQSHKYTEIEFVSGVNIICGQSQSGKTAILRAMCLISDNRPLGNNFIREGAEEAFVAWIGKAQGKAFSITRLRGKKNNCYEVVVGEEKAEFKAFGSGVPDKVKDLLNLSDVNVQNQLSPYFLVLDTPGQVALYIRSIAKLDEIDDVVSMLSSKIRISLGDTKRVAEQLEDVEGKLKVLDKINLSDLEKNIKIHDALTVEMKVLDDEAYTLGFNLDSLYIHEQEVSKINLIDISTLRIRYDECIKFLSSTTLLDAEIRSLYSILRGLREVESNKIVIPDDMKEIFVLCDSEIKKLSQLEDDVDILGDYLGNIQITSGVLSKSSTELEGVETDRDAIFKEFVDCPYCGQNLTSEAKNMLLERECSSG